MLFIFLRASAKSRIMYRTDFIIGLVGTLFYNAAFIASIGIITSRFNSIGGWSMWEMLFLYSLFMLGHSIYGFFFINMTMLNRTVMEGALDKYFLRPFSILVQMNGTQLNYTAFVDVVIGITGVVVAYHKLELNWRLFQYLVLIVFAVSGALIEYSLSLAMNCITFILPNSSSMYSAFYQFILIAQRYPLNIFGNGFQILLTFVFPLGFMNYYPSMLLLGKPGGTIGYFAPVVAAICVFIAHIIFNRSIKSYCSTGN